MSTGLRRVGEAAEPRPKSLFTMTLPDPGLHGIVVLPDGDTCVVSAENDGVLYIASLHEGRPVDRLTGHTGPVNCLASADDGRLLLSASDDATIRVWDTRTWRVIATLEGHNGYVREVAGRGMVAVSGGEDGTLRVWDLEHETCRGVFKDHGASVDHVTISPDGRRAASASRTNQVLLWDLATPRLERELYGTGQVVHDMPGMSWLGDTYLLLGSNDTGVGHQGAPADLLFDTTGDLLYTADDEVICWDLREGVELTRFPRQKMIKSLAVHPELPLLAAASLHGIRITDLAGRPVISLTADTSGVVDIAFLQDGRLVSVHEDRAVRLWPALTGGERDGDRHSSRVDTLAVDPAGRWAATTEGNGEVFLWDLASGERASTLTVEDVRCAPFFTTGGDRIVVTGGDELHVLPVAGGEPRVIAPTTPEGHLFLSAAAPIEDDSILVTPYKVLRRRSGVSATASDAGCAATRATPGTRPRSYRAGTPW
jgi:WD40 repeat protein